MCAVVAKCYMTALGGNGRSELFLQEVLILPYLPNSRYRSPTYPVLSTPRNEKAWSSLLLKEDFTYIWRKEFGVLFSERINGKSNLLIDLHFGVS